MGAAWQEAEGRCLVLGNWSCVAGALGMVVCLQWKGTMAQSLFDL